MSLSILVFGLHYLLISSLPFTAFDLCLSTHVVQQQFEKYIEILTPTTGVGCYIVHKNLTLCCSIILLLFLDRTNTLPQRRSLTWGWSGVGTMTSSSRTAPGPSPTTRKKRPSSTTASGVTFTESSWTSTSSKTRPSVNSAVWCVRKNLEWKSKDGSFCISGALSWAISENTLVCRLQKTGTLRDNLENKDFTFVYTASISYF